MDMELQSLPDSEVFCSSSIDHQDVFMYDDEKRHVAYSRADNESPTYLDISGNKTGPFTVIKQEPDPDTLMSWTQKHPEHWSQNEILDWIYFVAGTIEVDPTTIRGEGFQNITGPELCRMKLEDFQKRDPINGKCFFEMFRSLHKDAFFIEPTGCDFNTPEPYTLTTMEVKQEQYEPKQCDKAETNIQLLDYRLSDKEMQVLIEGDWIPIDYSSFKDIDVALHEEYQSWPQDVGYSGSDSESVMSESSDLEHSNGLLRYPYNVNRRTGSTGSDVLSDDDNYAPVVPTTVTGHKQTTSKQRKPNSPRKQKPSGEQNKQQNRGRKPGQRNHLWEFIRDLLKDPKFNPLMLRWEEKETGVFRFVQSEAVAQMWGRKKNNPGMTYEKLSRAMRFCRTAGYFAEVPKTGKFPKKLCFRFGAKAYGWED